MKFQKSRDKEKILKLSKRKERERKVSHIQGDSNQNGLKLLVAIQGARPW